jgi:hypothetical protein
MRILRFNESNRFPTKVTQGDFFDKKSKFRMVDWSPRERTTLFNILTEKQKKRNIHWSTSSEFIEIHISREFCEIVKLDDDWFTIIHTDAAKTEYYICDEFEEVVNFLNNFI